MADWFSIILVVLLSLAGAILASYFLSLRSEINILPIEDEQQNLVKSTTKLSEKAFDKVWDNDEDSIYDDL